MRTFSLQSLSLALFAALVVAPSAKAQQSTTATYQDWVLQCVIKADPAPAQKICSIDQVTQVQGKNLPFSRITVEHPIKGHPNRLTVQVPVNVSLAAPLRIQSDKNDVTLAAPFDKCVPIGCFADFELKDDLFQKIRATDGAGKMMFKDAGGHDVTIPMSFKGFRQAFDALSKE